MELDSEPGAMTRLFGIAKIVERSGVDDAGELAGRGEARVPLGLRRDARLVARDAIRGEVGADAVFEAGRAVGRVVPVRGAGEGWLTLLLK